MTTSTIQSVSLLPIYFQTDKNSKFLSSTIDQLIQPAQLERVNAYIGYQPPTITITTSSVTSSTVTTYKLFDPITLQKSGIYYSTTPVLPRRQGTQITIDLANADDSFAGPYDLGFNWNMFGQIFTKVYIGTNGVLTFGEGSAVYSPITFGVLPYPTIYSMYTDLWEGYGGNDGTTPLNTGEIPGHFVQQGTTGTFQFFRMRFQGSHYKESDNIPTIPAYDYETTMYSDGTNQYVETIYQKIPRTVKGLGQDDVGVVVGIATSSTNAFINTNVVESVDTLGTGIQLSQDMIADNSSHVFYSTQNGGNWHYAGPGSFDITRSSSTVLISSSTYITSSTVVYKTSSTTTSYVDFSKLPTWDPSDSYIQESSSLRQTYQLEPALVTYNINGDAQSVTTIDDLSNEISLKGGYTDNFDRLFSSSVYPFYPQIDLDKFINYEQYFWLPSGSFLIDIDQSYLNVDEKIVGKQSATVTVNGTDVTLLNGMLVTFSGVQVDAKYQYNEFFVEGTGTSIVLVPINSLYTPEKFAAPITDLYDSNTYGYDFLGYDEINATEALIPEYITINRASNDKNPWSRYNRWVSKEVIVTSSMLNNKDVIIPISNRAVRPIIEFNPNIQLYNFGSTATDPVDLIDNRITDAFGIINGVEGSPISSNTTTLTSIIIDGVTVSYRNRIIFAADEDPLVRNTIFEVFFINSKVALVPAGTVAAGTSVLIKSGNQYAGTTWWFNGNQWVYGQQHTVLNEGPLFDLFDSNGISYSDQTSHLTNFAGNKIFGYSISDSDTITDTVLGLKLKYLNNNVKSSILFENYFSKGVINAVNNVNAAVTINASQTYFKINGNLSNVWQPLISPTIEKVINSNYYNIPLGLANNPLNSNLDLLVHGDLQDQKNKQGTRLISNHNPISFAMMFIGKREHSVIDAITKCSEEYNYFKLSLINGISQTSSNLHASSALDAVLETLNSGKTSRDPFYLSDMLGHGQNKTILNYTVKNTNIVSYALPIEFTLEVPSNTSILVYINNIQLTSAIDYTFDSIDPFVNILKPLAVGDQISINYYQDTKKSYIPPTPTKLGLYPSVVPSKFLDGTYITPTMVIQGHDGSIMPAFGDYRDDIVLEYELRIFNNLKVKYRKELFDIHSVDPGFYRDSLQISKYSFSEITSILEKDFIKWAINYGVDYTTNNTYDQNNSFTWNYPTIGSWRSIFKYYYDTDRPHTNPWEMLGLAQKPEWWDAQYGSAPYTSGNSILWSDLAQGKIAVTANGVVIDKFYARPNLLDIIPVDTFGNLLSPMDIGILPFPDTFGSHSWAVGNQGPAETAWRRSSSWPFALQKLLALTQPSSYSSLMYDPANMMLNQIDQWVYSNNNGQTFLRIADLPIHGDFGVPLNSGFSVFVSEIGQQRDVDYILKLRNDLKYVNFNLFYKVGGFLSKNTTQFFIDAYEPTTNSIGALLPNIDYSSILNVSNPINSIGISGIIIQRIGNDSFVVRGYDRDNPYFTYYPATRNSATPVTTIGGVSSDYVNWVPGYTSASSLSTLDTISAASTPANTFYQKDQIVQYGSSFYRVAVSHRAGPIFDSTLFSKLTSLPTSGGVSVQLVASFNTNAIRIPYGTTFSRVQDVYDLILGYGTWLVDQGFVFNQFNNDLGQVVDWNLSANEFLFWTTQNWVNNSILTVSPFADQFTYQFNKSIVDNIFNSFYDYSLTKADGTPFDKKNLFITRQNGVFTVATINTDDGIYFARLNSIQKEHGIIFKNVTTFGDIVYDVQTGNRQKRIKMVGFRTAKWNGEFSSPGFVYDAASVTDWAPNASYLASSIVRYNNFYYSARTNIDRSKVFDFTKWKQLIKKPIAGLLPNFDYKINQFNDFYSLDIDNFDIGQQKSAQNLIGYSPRVYLNNVIPNTISQYKFYQGYIRDKGTKNAILKLSKARSQNLKNNIQIYENWAMRVGQYGNFTSVQEFEFPLIEGSFIENPQIITFEKPVSETTFTPVQYIDPGKFTISPKMGSIPRIHTTNLNNAFKFIHAGYVRLDDVDATAYNQTSLLDIANSKNLLEGTTIWLGFKPNGDWDVLRYKLLSADIVDAVSDTIYHNVTISTSNPHNLIAGQIVSIVGINSLLDGVYTVESIVSSTQFVIVNSNSFASSAYFTFPGFLFTFESLRFPKFDNIPSDDILYQYSLGTRLWIDSENGTGNDGWAVYKKVNNFFSNIIYGNHSLSDGHGVSISLRKNSDILVVGSPLYKNTSDGTSGAIVVYKNSTLEEIAFYAMPNTSGNNKLGTVVFYDDVQYPNKNSPFGLVFAGAPGAYDNKGMLQIISIDLTYQSTVINTLTNNVSSGTFGSSIFVQRNTSTKQMLVGAPAINKVYSYIVTATANSLLISPATTVTSIVSLDANAQWGYSIVGSDNANYLAVSAPFNGPQNSGTVSIIRGTTIIQTLYSPFGNTGNFGQAMTMSGDGSYLAISAPNAVNINTSFGAVAIYNNTYTGGIYTLTQVLTNLIPNGKMYFGMALDINTLSNALVVTAMGTNTTVITIFDNLTTFDFNSTRFIESEDYSGTAYLYNRKNKNFKFSQEINEFAESVSSLTNFGTSVAIDNDIILVGAPAVSNQNTGSVYKFSKIDKSIDGWKTDRIQDDLLLPNSVKQIRLIDTVSDEIINYFDFVDPLKGKILGVAEEELTYITSADPAIYSLGGEGVNVNPNTSWIDQQIGKLWWDVSTAKFIWYEQGELEYRKNNWGKLFPGASIDVYEWVGSSLLPSEWSAIADTPSGMTQGISGQPKYVDNSAISIKQVYDNVVGSLSNIYYYWVKNKVTVPDVKNRKISAFSVASYIANPTSSGIQHVAFISTSSLIIANASVKLRSDEISLNFTIDNSNNKTLNHVEWQLVKEGLGKIPPIIEKKLFDSLIGNDSLGNTVPDPKLSNRAKFGIDIRPQQTLFDDRSKALRNIVDFANSVLIKNQTTGNRSFQRLSDQELPPQPTTSSWVVVEDSTALIEITDLQITTATVISDSNGNGGWAVYQNSNGIWNKIRTQSYNTLLYWRYVDWASDDFEIYKKLSHIIDTVYQLNQLTVLGGQYVKIKNRGDGNYIIVTPAASGTVGTFNANYNVIYVQNGTIQLNNNLWDLSYGWDNSQAYSQSLFDQTPNIEISNILHALKNDLFINELSENWNLLVFKAVKYVFSEQKFVNWAFKTSLIDVVNYAGTLTQPPVYKLQDAAYYENFVNEVKPYHTKVRQFTTEFENFEAPNTTITDFDYPVIFNSTSQQYVFAPIPLSNFTFPECYNTSSGIVTTASYTADIKLITVPWRETSSRILFDRISARDQLGNLTVVDNFLGKPGETLFQLSWLAQADKSKIQVQINGVLVFNSMYTITYTTERYQSYNKKYSYLKLLKLETTQPFNLTVIYQKSTELMSAAERIQNFYAPSDAMPGNDLGQLMSGVVDPRKIIGGQYEGTGFSNVNSGQLADTILNPSTSDYPSWGGGRLINALGIDNTDNIIDGSFGFVSTATGQSLEEFVPGLSVDSLAIDVYTKSAYQTPTIFNGSNRVYSSTLTQTFNLSVMPPTVASIVVTINNNLLTYVTSTTFTTSTQFNINWTKKTLTVPPQKTGGILGYSIIGVGDADYSGLGIIDTQSFPVIVTTTVGATTIIGMVNYNEVGGAYVTVDGLPISNTVYPNVPGQPIFYSLNTASIRDSRVSVLVYNLPTGSHLIQSWFFNSTNPKFNKLTEQVYSTGSAQLGTYNQNGYANSISLTNMPANLGPFSSQIILELIPNQGNPIRLRPPYVTYYTVTTTNVALASYPIVSSTSSFAVTGNASNIQVYLNGLPLSYTLDYTISNNSVTLTSQPASSGNTPVVGSKVAIETFYYNNISNAVSNTNGIVPYDYDFMVTTDGSSLLLTPNYSYLTSATLKITTFAIQDSLGMVSQRFVGSPLRTYKLSYPVLNSNYLWVEADTTSTGLISLVNNIDYQMLGDNLTVLISDAINLTNEDTVFIMSFADPSRSAKTLGYRISKDFLGKTSFTRLSNDDSTYLTSPLTPASNSIYVADGSILSQPDSDRNIPGVVLIAGERIEFFKNIDNVLSQLRRATGGTAPAAHLDIGTIVLDQGANQTINVLPATPYSDTVLVQNTFTSAALENTYIISTTTVYNWVNPKTSATIQCDGIKLMTTKSTLPNDSYIGTEIYQARSYHRPALMQKIKLKYTMAEDC